MTKITKVQHKFIHSHSSSSLVEYCDYILHYSFNSHVTHIPITQNAVSSEDMLSG
ncbi:hypothetical protein [Clostridium botulinum]